MLTNETLKVLRLCDDSIGEARRELKKLIDSLTHNTAMKEPLWFLEKYKSPWSRKPHPSLSAKGVACETTSHPLPVASNKKKQNKTQQQTSY